MNIIPIYNLVWARHRRRRKHRSRKNNSTLLNFNKAKSLFVVIFVSQLISVLTQSGAGRDSVRCAACFARRHFLKSNSNGIVCAVIKYFITYLAPHTSTVSQPPPPLRPHIKVIKKGCLIYPLKQFTYLGSARR